jgi:cathepsin B
MIQKNYGTILLSDSEMNKQLSQLNLDKTSSKFKSTIEVPLFFDGRKTWNEYINEIDYQSNCVSCWAFATLFVLSSRLSIYTKGKYNLKFSTAKMIFQKNNLIWDDIKKDITIGNTFDYIDADKKTVVNKCSVNSLLEAWQYLYCFGVPEEKCVNDKSKIDNIYTSTILFGNSYDKCPATNEEMVCHRVSGYYYVPGTASKNILFEPGNESNIRREIYHWGPCSTVMRVFQDFLDWDGIGIYKWDSKSKQINSFGHAIVLIGWGEESGIKYWIARNSWGENWGDKGYFKIVRGLNNCEIEENVFVGYPTLPSLKLFIEYPILYRFDDFIIRGKWGIQDNGYKLTSYEKLLLKKEKVKDFIYDVDSWTNFSNFIAGNDIIKKEFKEEFEEEFEDEFEDDYNIFNDEDLLNKIILLILFFLSLKIFCK